MKIEDFETGCRYKNWLKSQNDPEKQIALQRWTMTVWRTIAGRGVIVRKGRLWLSLGADPVMQLRCSRS